MSRKNLLNHTLASGGGDRAPAPGFPSAPASRPIAAVGKLGSLLREMNTEAGQVADLQRMLASAKHVVDLDPDLIDPSRSGIASTIQIRRTSIACARASFATANACRSSSDQNPTILNVMSPYTATEESRSRRRRRSSFAPSWPTCPRKTRSSPRARRTTSGRTPPSLSDAFYARRLNERGMAIIRIAAALAVPVSTVSESVKVAERIPEDLIVAVGPAPGVGRRRWLALIPHIPRDRTVWDSLVVKPDFQALSSDERFEAVFAALAKPPTGDPQASRAASLSDGAGVYVTIKKTAKAAMLTISRDAAPRPDGVSFADWIESRLASLREDYLQGR